MEVNFQVRVHAKDGKKERFDSKDIEADMKALVCLNELQRKLQTALKLEKRKVGQQIELNRKQALHLGGCTKILTGLTSTSKVPGQWGIIVLVNKEQPVTLNISLIILRGKKQWLNAETLKIRTDIIFFLKK
jgi:hypothetical protein